MQTAACGSLSCWPRIARLREGLASCLTGTHHAKMVRLAGRDAKNEPDDEECGW